MILIVNGEEKEFDEKISLQEVISSLKIEDKVMAAAINMNIVKKDDWKSYIPVHNDKLELLQFVGGG